MYDGQPSFSASPEEGPLFHKGDRIESIDGKSVKDAVEFNWLVAASSGKSVSIAVERHRDEKGRTLAKPEPATITLTDNYFRTMGLTLDSGPIAAVHGITCGKGWSEGWRQIGDLGRPEYWQSDRSVEIAQ